MNRDHFTVIFEETVDRSRQSLLSKNEEYGKEQDVFRAFTQAGHLQDMEPHQALLGMLAKHTTSIYDMGDDHILDHHISKWEEKIMDHINYLILLRAMVLDANRKPTAFKMFADNREYVVKSLPTLEQCIESVHKQDIFWFLGFEYVKPLADKILTLCIEKRISDPDLVLVQDLGMDTSVNEGVQVTLGIRNDDHEEVVYITPEPKGHKEK